VLDNLIKQGCKEGDPSGWPGTFYFVLEYLTVANSMIAGCEEISAIGPAPTISSQPQARYSRRRAQQDVFDQQFQVTSAINVQGCFTDRTRQTRQHARASRP
jgi:hypothetical protein